MAGKNEKHPIPSVVGKIETPMPTDHPVYDYMFEVISYEFSIILPCMLLLWWVRKTGGRWTWFTTHFVYWF